MLIDWFTVGAQIINFLILIWLLRRFLYGPIMRAMQERERLIAERVQQSEAAKQEATAQSLAYRELQHQLESRRTDLLAQAKGEAQLHREELVRQAADEVSRQRRQWLEGIEQDRSRLLRELSDRVARATVVATQKALGELADEQLEPALIRAFVRRLESLDRAAIEQLRQATEGTDGVVIRTGFDIGGPVREQLQGVLVRVLGEDSELHWEPGSLASCGIELSGGGHRVGWSFDDFSRDIEHDVGQLLSRAQVGRDHEQPGA